MCALDVTLNSEPSGRSHIDDGSSGSERKADHGVDQRP